MIALVPLLCFKEITLHNVYTIEELKIFYIPPLLRSDVSRISFYKSEQCQYQYFDWSMT